MCCSNLSSCRNFWWPTSATPSLAFWTAIWTTSVATNRACWQHSSKLAYIYQVEYRGFERNAATLRTKSILSWGFAILVKYPALVWYYLEGVGVTLTGDTCTWVLFLVHYTRINLCCSNFPPLVEQRSQTKLFVFTHAFGIQFAPFHRGAKITKKNTAFRDIY